MFGSLKKKLREGVAKLSGKADAPPAPGKPDGRVPAPVPEKPAPPAKREVPKAAKPPKADRRPARERPRKEPEREGPKYAPKPDTRAFEKPAAQERAPEAEEPVPETSGQEPVPEQKGRFARLRERVSTREITAKDIDDFFDDSEVELLQSDVAVEVMDSLKEKLKSRLVDTKVGRGKDAEAVASAFRESLLEIVDQGRIDLVGLARKARKEGRPLTMVFLGFNGAGKTTSIAKTAAFLKKNGITPVLAAADTFRAAAVEQIEIHGERLGVKVIKHQYGSDSAAVIFDARKYAEKKGLDVVLADTAGRMHTDKNLMDELRKVIRVNQPDLRVLVVDSLTGNDAVEQARMFNEAVGVDCVVMTKTDVNPRGGSILSVAHTIRKPILFLGTGQEYDKVEMFDPGKFVSELMG